MSFPGKKLQDIYDDASQKLAELEGDASTRLKDLADAHQTNRKNVEADSLAQMEDRARDVESELRTQSTLCVDRLKKLIELEKKTTDQHVKQQLHDLDGLADRLRNSIADLKRVYADSLDDLYDSLSNDYSATVEQVSSEIERQSFSSQKNLKAHGTFLANALQQKLDHNLWESRGGEKQINSTLLKTYMQKAGSIETHFSMLTQKMSSEFQNQYKDLEQVCRQSVAGIDNESPAWMEQLENVAGEAEKNIQRFFKETLDRHNKTLNGHLGSIAEDLGNMHVGATANLSQKTQEYSSNLVAAAEAAQDALKEKCEEVESKVDADMEAFSSRIETKVKSSSALREDLESTKSSVINDIRKELVDIRNGFEERLAAMVKEATDRVKNITREADADIKNAQQRCMSKLNTDGTSARTEIEEATQRLLKSIEEQREAALAEIGRQAGK